jgi:DNA-binding CsgD family transcriptional regulator
MLLGRDRELEAITALLESARTGSSGVLVLVGESGIGKSALLDWAAVHATGMRVLRARGVQSEAQIPFAGLHELLRPALDHVGRLPVSQRAALEGALALRPARAHDRAAVGAATLTLLAAHADTGPLAVLIDDAHWLDGSSADALRFALRRLLADPIAVLLTARAGEESLLDDAAFTTLPLRGLDEQAATELVRRDAPHASSETALRLHRQTGGNPLALRELSQEPPSEIPLELPAPGVTSVAATFLQRARGLPVRSRSALVLAAANDGGETSVFARAAECLGLAVADLVPAEEKRLIEIDARSIGFRHPLIRSAIYGDAPAEQRRAAHRALADALPDADADRRAWHLALAAVGPDELASSALQQAGERARGRSAYDVASHAFERAAFLATNQAHAATLTHSAAEAAWSGGRGERALTLLDAAGRQTTDEPLLWEIEHLRGHIAVRQGPLDEARSILVAAAERAAVNAPDTAVVMLAEAAEGALFAGDAAGMRGYGERATALEASATGARASFFARITAGMGRILAGDGEHGADLIRSANAVLERADVLDEEPRLLAWAVFSGLWLREAGDDETFVDNAIATARTRSALGVLPHLLTYVGIGQMATRRYVEARATLDEAIRLARETGQYTILTGALARLAWLEARSGRTDACHEHADEACSLARELGARLFEIWALTALAELDLGAGDARAALIRFDEQQAALERYEIGDADLSPAPERVELHLRLGRDGEARAAAAPFVAAAEAKQQPWALARAARCRALLAGDDDFEPLFEEALTAHTRTPDAFERARTQLTYGARLRRAAARSRARGPLRAALETFDDLGARPWAELARAELAATGETARRRDPSTLDELTPQELQISLLLAGGKTTRETAAALFLSPKTIEYHLRNAYRKLDVRSRPELAVALDRLR